MVQIVTKCRCQAHGGRMNEEIDEVGEVRGKIYSLQREESLYGFIEKLERNRK